MDRQTFFGLLGPQAQRARIEGSPLFPSVRLAQNLLETGGRIDEHYNLGGIKAGGGKPNQWWRGETYTTPTWEFVNGKRVQALGTWRSYKSVYHFYKDQDLLLGHARYARVRAAKTAPEQAEALQLSRYATDPAYSNKLSQLIKTYDLTKYDDFEEADIPMTTEEREQFEQLQKEASEQTALIRSLADRLALVENRQIIAEPPVWAAAAVQAAVDAKLIDTPRGGSYDFYRLLTVLHRKNII
ncbi:glycoside hydrolase family 73 protein [Cohnella hashimotonis]|uniref:Glucosaminidase domain-containing protein n=1 Tax=Cohnella hashimotonis TaxID=2826895 RepID=A0ABT6TDE2_9BACL|nr:glucosaminidase domain-containing protein [Cohnella hashimotonis]MDI4644789.1 glucosaminidase domain-containing protein [Cohnella hashimotonis]